MGGDLTLRASIYQWTLHNLIVENSFTGYYQNDPPVDTRGIELSADKTWDSGARLRGSMSYQDADYRGGGEVVNSPKVLGKLNFSSRLPGAGLRVGLEERYDSSRLTLDGTTLGGYALSNIYLSKEAILKGLDVSLAVNNLFDKRYAQPASANNWQNSFEQDGLSARISAAYAF
jgi:iron complex outermembrane receptor protein